MWLNNPLRPLEACGTSGMKSALNGGLNLSVRHGWWDEWDDGADGCAIPSADGVEDPERRDELESHSLYEPLSQTVAPRFYDTGTDGLPRRWLEMVGHTLRALGPRVQASRMVREYVEELYIPAALASRALRGHVAGEAARPGSSRRGDRGPAGAVRGRPGPGRLEAPRHPGLGRGPHRARRRRGRRPGPRRQPGGRATVALGGLSPTM